MSTHLPSGRDRRAGGRQHGVVSRVQLRAAWTGSLRDSAARRRRAPASAPSGGLSRSGIPRAIDATGDTWPPCWPAARGRSQPPCCRRPPRPSQKPDPDRGHVSSRGRTAPPGITVHRSRMMDPVDFTVVDGIPVTTVARTLLISPRCSPYVTWGMRSIAPSASRCSTSAPSRTSWPARGAARRQGAPRGDRRVAAGRRPERARGPASRARP